MKMFRGQSQEAWTERMRDAGWPPMQADRIASFLVGDSEAPEWEELVKPLVEDFLSDMRETPFIRTGC